MSFAAPISVPLAAVTVASGFDLMPTLDKSADVIVNLMGFTVNRVIGPATEGVVTNVLIPIARSFINSDWKVQLAAVGVTALIGTVLSFRKKSLGLPDKPNEELMLIRPTRSAYLVWTRSRDGSYSSVFNVTPLPPVRNLMTGGGAVSTSSTDINMLHSAIKKGYIKNELPRELQDYIKKHSKIIKEMTGGDSDSDLIETIISEAKEPAQFVIDQDDPETINLVMPLPELQQEALFHVKFENVPEPSTPIFEDIDKLPKIEHTEEERLVRTIQMLKCVKERRKNKKWVPHASLERVIST
jgi:hypothetical protein